MALLVTDMKHIPILLLMVLPLFACVSEPVRDSADGGAEGEKAAGPTPIEVRETGLERGEVHWGGQIVRIDNRSDRTLIEVLALPLDSDGVPRTNAQPQGRFIVDKSGFLEPQQYAAGRLVEVRGQLKGFTDGKVGEADYRYPVVISERVRLLDSDAAGSAGGPRFFPSIGIGVGSGGSSWGGVGVGIGF